MNEQQKLTLYHYLGCPFCSMVERVIDELGVEVERLDILRDAEAMQELVGATGRKTVPVLKIGEGEFAQWMPESRHIMDWLRHRFATD